MTNRITRSTVAYWFLGLCNNLGYVVMLSAAHDILKQKAPAGTEDHHSESIDPSKRYCNELSTGVILLADIIPALVVKIIGPFLPLWMHVRMILVLVSSALGFVLVGMSKTLTMALAGVACTSFSSGLGESSLLSYTIFYENDTIIGGWSSGTGGAGIFGALIYAVLINVGLTPSVTLYVLIVVPIWMGISFWIILQSPSEALAADERKRAELAAADASSSTTTRPTTTEMSTSHSPDHPHHHAPQEISHQSIWSRLKDLKKAIRYIIPLVLVYYFEYIINQGLFELCVVDDGVFSRSEQYRWYQFCYQVGVFLSRSSITFVHIRHIWFLAALQAINVIFFTTEALYLYIPSIFIMYVITIWEGLLGGAAYVNTYYKIQIAEDPEDQEVITGMTSCSDSLGIALAGMTAIPLHNYICSLPKL